MNGRTALRLLSTGLFGLTMLVPPLEATIAALLGVGLLVGSLSGGAVSKVNVRLATLGGVSLAALALLLGLTRGAINFPEPAGWTPSILLAATAVMIVLVTLRPSATRLASWVGIGLFLVLSFEVMLTFGGNLYGLDVYRSHEAAAEAIRAGDNPYTDAVTVADGSPNAGEGDVIEGYSYPPVTLAAYVTGDFVAGDPRWVSVVSVLVVVGAMVAVGKAHHNVVGGVLLLLVSVPLHRAIIWSGWTEPLSLVLLLGGVLLWRRNLLSSVLIGLALASKQYLVVLVPLLFLVDTRPWRRSVVALSAAAATLVPALLADASSFWFTMVARPLSLGFRPDTRSISGALSQLGFELEIPTWLMLATVLGVSVWLFRKVADQSDLLAAMAAVLAATFLLSLAFTNYWWLVQWLVAGSAVVSARSESSDDVIRIGV